MQVIERLREDQEAALHEIESIDDQDEKCRLLSEQNWTYLKKFDDMLDGNTNGPMWLSRYEVASKVNESLYEHDGKGYDLLAHTIMPNHVHLVFEHAIHGSSQSVVSGQSEAAVSISVMDLLRLIKGSSARYCNDLLRRSGAFWQHESYDHVIRDNEELVRTILYVLNNPVKVGLVKSWKEWPWSYCKTGLFDIV